ncbi:MAG: hypothetical protein GY847_29705 [Proteobacteria bacterium]|nr:hypothetical protein [Pseudomonadota bacterium]
MTSISKFRMSKVITLLFVLSSAITIAIYILLQGNEEHTISIDKTRHNEIPIVDKIKREEDKKRKPSQQDRYRAIDALQALTREINNDNQIADHRDDESPYTDEQRMKLEELHRKTAPYYWEMAPDILEEMLQSESRGDFWQKAVEHAVDNILMYEESSGTDVLDVDCRQRLCKIRFEHENTGSHSDFMDGQMDDGPWISGAGIAMGGNKIQEDGAVKSYIYFTKMGDMSTFYEMRETMAKKIDDMKKQQLL